MRSQIPALPIVPGPRYGLFLLAGLLVTLAAAGAALFLNSYPIFIYDTERYIPSHQLTSMGSSLPHFLNLPLFPILGVFGAAFSGMLASATALPGLLWVSRSACASPIARLSASSQRLRFSLSIRFTP